MIMSERGFKCLLVQRVALCCCPEETVALRSIMVSAFVEKICGRRVNLVDCLTRICWPKSLMLMGYAIVAEGCCSHGSEA